MWFGRIRIVFFWKFPQSDEIYIIPFKFMRGVCGCKVIILFNFAFILSTRACYKEAKRLLKKKNKDDLP